MGSGTERSCERNRTTSRKDAWQQLTPWMDAVAELMIATGPERKSGLRPDVAMGGLRFVAEAVAKLAPAPGRKR
jgi:hypothetical protein